MLRDKHKTTLTRVELYELVWKEPVIKLAKDFGISDVGLAKTCRRHSIPLPPRGYWAKLEHGRRVPKRPILPKNREADEIITIRGLILDGDNTHTGKPQLADYVDEVPCLDVPEILQSPHPLIEKTAKILSAARKSSGLIQPRQNSQVLDIRVSHEALDRALRVMDTLLKALDRCQATIALDKNSKTTFVKVKGERIEIQLREEMDRIPHDPTPAELKRKQQYSWTQIPTHDAIPSGRLTLSISNYIPHGIRKNWSDGKQQRIENCLEKFILGLFLTAEGIKADRAEKERWEREWQEKQRLDEIARRKQMVEEKRAKFLLETTKAWSTANQIHNFICEVENMAKSHKLDNTDDIQDWIEWARNYANTIDPIFDSLPRLATEKELFKYGYD